MIYLVRHGEAAASWGDHPNPGLSALGQDQAITVAQRLATKDIKHVITSPMQRCRETAAPFEALSGRKADVESRVSEVGTPSEVEDRVSWLQQIMAGQWTGAGSDLLAWRTQLVECVKTMPSGSVVFTHFVAINAVVSALEGRDEVLLFRPGHCSVTGIDNSSDECVVVERGGEGVTKVL